MGGAGRAVRHYGSSPVIWQWLWGMESSSILLNLRVGMTAVAEELDVAQIKEKQSLRCFT